MTEAHPQAQVRDAARRAAQQHLAPGAAERDRERRFPRAELARLGEQGLLGVLVPTEWDGAGGDYGALIAAVEEIAACDGVCAMIAASQNTLANLILLRHGSEAQKHEFLRPLAAGTKLCGFALTEAHSGSDAFRMKTTARRDGDFYILDGSKQFVTAADQADYVLVLARSDEKKKNAEAFSAFLVATDSPGYHVGRREDTLGMRSSATCPVTLDGLRVPVAQRIGAEGDGYAIANAQLDASRVAIAAQALGLAQAAQRIASRYALERQAFGKAIITHQAILFRLADMELQLHAARLLCEDAARRLDAGEACTKQSSMAKLFASEMAERVTHDAIQVLGGYGYLRDFTVERLYRDARVCTIYEGTSDIQRLLIGHALIEDLRAFSP